MGKIPLNLDPSQPLTLVKKFPYFNDSIEIYVLLAGAFHLCIHDLINCSFLKVVKVDFYRGQALNYL
jgi:hypothetical protein